MVSARFLVFSSILLLLIAGSGCLYVRDAQECEAMRNGMLNCSGFQTCYHEVATQRAFTDVGGAVAACREIGTVSCVGTNAEMDNCFSDVAEISHNVSVCDNIEEGITDELIGGIWTSYKQECQQKASKVSHPIDICAAPPALIAAVALLAYAAHRKK